MSEGQPILCYRKVSAAPFDVRKMGARSAICHNYLPVGIAPPYLTMQECLIDIEHAIHHGYVITSLEDKLLKRKEKCLTQQRKAKEHRASNREEDPSDFNAFKSEHVTVKSHHTCGRYIEV